MQQEYLSVTHPAVPVVAWTQGDRSGPITMGNRRPRRRMLLLVYRRRRRRPRFRRRHLPHC